MNKTFNELRELSGYAKGYNFLILFSILSALMLHLSLKSFQITKPLYLVLYNRIKDGYFLVVLSPILFITWIVATVLLVILNIPSICLLGFCSIAEVYGVIFELPSDYINKNKNDRDERDLLESWMPYITTVIAMVVVIVPCLTLVQPQEIK